MVVLPDRVGDRLLANRTWKRPYPPYFDRDPLSGCWVWRKAGMTYGMIGWREDGENHHMVAHRAMYLTMVGLIPEGLDLDHLCRNRACVNPDHLEPVTRKENIRRGIGHGTQTHCAQGHPFSPENTLKRGGGRPGRRCKTCVNRVNREVYQRMGRAERRGGRPR